MDPFVVVFDAVSGHPILEKKFITENRERHKGYFRSFLTAKLGGPIIYSGRDIWDVHKALDITEPEYSAFEEVFTSAVHQMNVDVEGDILAVLTKLKDDICNPLFRQLGGQKAVEQISMRFMEKVKESELADVFAARKMDIDTHSAAFRRYLTQMLGGEIQYQGDILKVHAPMKIEEEEFGHFIRVIEDVLTELQIGQDLAKRVIDRMRMEEHLIRNPMFDRIEGTLERAINDLMAVLAADSYFNDRMKNVKADEVSREAMKYFAQIWGGPKKYSGPPPEDILRPMKIGNYEWDKVERLFLQCLTMEGENEYILDCILEVRNLSARLREHVVVSLQSRLGGESCVERIMSECYAKMRQNKRFRAMLPPGFEINEARSQLTAFLVFVCGGDKPYNEGETEAIFQPLYLKHADSELVFECLEMSLKVFGLSDAIVEEVLEIAAPLRKLITNALFDRIGGKDVVADIVDAFYEKVLQGEVDVFRNCDRASLKTSTCSYFASTMGAAWADLRDEAALKTLYRDLQIDDESGQALLNSMGDVLDDKGIDPEMNDAVLKGLSDLIDYATRKRNVWTSETNGYKETALHIGAQKGDTKECRYLLEEDANPNCKDDTGSTPLHRASRHGMSDVVQLLLDFDADPNASTTNSAQTPMHRAAFADSGEIITTLFEAGAALNAESALGETPIKIAMKYKKFVAVEVLTKLGAL